MNIIDISNPLQPTLIGSFAEDGYSHDAQIVNYIGPDTSMPAVKSRSAFNENTVTIVDVTDATDRSTDQLYRATVLSYTHQGWLTEDHKYLLVNDELDEGSVQHPDVHLRCAGPRTTSALIGTHVGTTRPLTTTCTPTKGLAYQSNYRAGLANFGLGERGPRAARRGGVL